MARSIVTQTPGNSEIKTELKPGDQPDFIAGLARRQARQMQNFPLDAQRHGDIHSQDISPASITARQLSSLDIITMHPSLGLQVQSAGVAVETFDASGRILRPLQPAFLAVFSVNRLDVTGDGTTYTAQFDKEIFDQGNNFNTTTFTFTAPVTGRYLLSCTGGFRQLTASGKTNADMHIITSNRDYQYRMLYLTVTLLSAAWSVIADMDAADTAYCTFRVVGGLLDVDIDGEAAGVEPTFFSGILLA